MWIDRVVSLEAGVRLSAVKSVSIGEEPFHACLDGDGTAPAVMPMSLIIEGMAQTGGILVGHAEQFREKVILAKIAKAELEEDAPPGSLLRYTATIERMSAQGASTNGVVELLDPSRDPIEFRRIGQIDLIFSHLDQNAGAAGATGEAFPEHNFVFGDTFKALLRLSGVAYEGG